MARSARLEADTKTLTASLRGEDVARDFAPVGGGDPPGVVPIVSSTKVNISGHGSYP